METRERLIRLEEVITRQGDLIEKMLHQMDMRIEQVNRRIDELTLQMNIRFEQMEDRIERVDKRCLPRYPRLSARRLFLAQFIG